MSWMYLTLDQAAVMLWNTSAAQEWDFLDYSEMIEEIKHNTFYAFIENGNTLALMRLRWVIQPYSGYFWLWVRKDLRRPRKFIKNNTKLHQICIELYKLMKNKIKIKRLMSLCVHKSVARLCVRFFGEQKCVLEDLFHKGGNAYVIYWKFS